MMASLSKQIERSAAIIASRSGEVREFADEVAQSVRGFAAEHTDSGDYAKSIKVEDGRIDSIVVSTDPDALSKEFGRALPGGGRTRGVHAFGKAMGKHG